MALDNQALDKIVASLGGHPDANATEQPAAETTSNNSTAASEKLLAGKYKSPEELERGYTHQMTETQKIIAERDQLKQKLELAEGFITDTRMGADRSMPADRAAARKSNLDTIAEQLNVDREQLAGAMAEIAAQTFAPITSGIQARQIVNEENPDFVKFEPEVAQFLKANPQLDARVGKAIRQAASDPEALALLLDYSYMKYDRSKTAGTTTVPRNDTSGTEQAQAKIDATIPGAGAGRAAGTEAVENQALTNAWQKGQDNGDWTDFLNLRLQGIIPDTHYNANAGVKG